MKTKLKRKEETGPYISSSCRLWYTATGITHTTDPMRSLSMCTNLNYIYIKFLLCISAFGEPTDDLAGLVKFRSRYAPFLEDTS